MVNKNSNTEKLIFTIKNIEGIDKINEVEITNNLIKCVNFVHSKFGDLEIKQIKIDDSKELFDFYFKSLSEEARIFFCPYPIFNPRPHNPEELAETIRNWQKEDDWTILKLSKNKQIIGICLLKKFKTNKPTSGLAIHEKFQKMGLGNLLQIIINEQARLLGIKELVITLAPDNMASLKVHQKAGFKQTGRRVPHFTYINGVKKIDRDDIEMVKKI